MDLSTSKIVVRTLCNNEFRFVILDYEKFSLDDFMEAVQVKFHIKGNFRVNAVLRDNLSTRIAADDFCTIVQNYSKSGSFYVHLEYNIVQQNPALVSNEVLRQFLIDNDGGQLLKENEETGALTDKGRKRLINKSTDLLIKLFGSNPTKTQRVLVARAIINVFPFLKTIESETGGIDLLVNPRGGYIDNRLKQIHTVMRKEQRIQERADVNIDVGVTAAGLNALSLTDIVELSDSSSQHTTENRDPHIEARSDVQFLKSVVANEQNLKIVKEKLLGTAEYRKEMLRNKKTELRVEFPYFFTNPDLILFDFGINYPHTDPCAFEDFWKAESGHLRCILNRFYSSNTFSSAWPNEIEDFFILPRLLAAKNKLSIEVFNKVMDKLVVFKAVGTSPEEMLDKSNTFPRIIAYGLSPGEILHYYIEVEKELIDIPARYTFVETFATFFKLHFTFNIDFEPNLVPAMKFFEHFVFKISPPRFKPSNRMLEIWNKLQSLNSGNIESVT